MGEWLMEDYNFRSLCFLSNEPILLFKKKLSSFYKIYWNMTIEKQKQTNKNLDRSINLGKWGTRKKMKRLASREKNQKKHKTSRNI